MSHVKQVEFIYSDLAAMQRAAARFGMYCREQDTYRWFGESIGDYPLPTGFTEDMLGKCKFAMGLNDRQAYEIGIDAFGQSLPDGGADGILRVKTGVTLMIDAGAVFKLRRGTIVVGSSSPTVDRSGAAMQVLGTPDTPAHRRVRPASTSCD